MSKTMRSKANKEVQKRKVWRKNTWYLRTFVVLNMRRSKRQKNKYCSWAGYEGPKLTRVRRKREKEMVKKIQDRGRGSRRMVRILGRNKWHGMKQVRKWGRDYAMYERERDEENHKLIYASVTDRNSLLFQ